jgi:AraC family transcriptional regulator
MNLTSESAGAVMHLETALPLDGYDHATHIVRVSSHGLGWKALNFERRDYRPSSRALARGSRDHLIFVGLTPGRVVCERGGERVEHELSPGCVALVPAYTPVSWSWSTRISLSVLRLDPGFLDQVAQSVFGLGPRDYRLAIAERSYDTAITNIAGVLSREAMRGQRGGELYAESLASILAVHLLRHYALRADGQTLETSSTQEEIAPAAVPAVTGGRNGAQRRAVSDALQFMHANFAREVSLGDIAGAVHVSPFHLARLFKQWLGVSPHQYLIQVRVDNARWLLSAGSGERSLAEVASAVGFADQSHLTRHFKRVTGVTPRQFRP